MRALLVSMIVLLAQPVFADSPPPNFGPPHLSLDQAIKQGKACLAEKKIDVSQYYIQSVSFERLGKTPRRWTLRWELNTLAKGGWLLVFLDEGAPCQLRLGE